MSPVKVVLAGGLAVIAVALVVTLSGAPTTVARWNGVLAKEQIAATSHPAVACQSGEALPRGTSAIRASMAAYTGPAASVHVYAAGRLIASGKQAAGWNGVVVTIPVKPLSRAYARARVCVSVAVTPDEEVRIFGKTTKPALAARAGGGEPLPGRLRIDYLQAGHRSWFSMATLIAKHMSYGNFGGGAWNALLVLMLTIALLAVTCRLVLRELR